jgi:hypothetical protein
MAQAHGCFRRLDALQVRYGFPQCGEFSRKLMDPSRNSQVATSSQSMNVLQRHHVPAKKGRYMSISQEKEDWKCS